MHLRHLATTHRYFVGKYDFIILVYGIINSFEADHEMR